MKKDSSSSEAIKIVGQKQYFNQFQNMNDFEKIMNMWYAFKVIEILIFYCYHTFIQMISFFYSIFCMLLY